MEANQLARTRACCSQWAAEVHQAQGTLGAFLFGSTVDHQGELFEPPRSDVDLVVVMPASVVRAEDRSDWLAQVLNAKKDLEKRLLEVLSIENASQPIVSVVAPTVLEIESDVHKSGETDFFRSNRFLSLLSDHPNLPIDPGSRRPIDVDARRCLECAQAYRNKYLSVSANGRGGIAKLNGVKERPIPKDIMRNVARLAPEAAGSSLAATKLNVQFGLDYLFSYLYSHRNRSDALHDLYAKITVRRLADGTRESLSSHDQLVLAELVHELAVQHLSTGVDEAAARSLFRIATDSATPAQELLDRLQQLAGDPTLTVDEIPSGYRIESRKDTYELLARLARSEELDDKLGLAVEALQLRVRVTLKRSVIGHPKDQRAAVKGLGIRRTNQTVELEDTPSVRGMIRKVRHLVTTWGNHERRRTRR